MNIRTNNKDLRLALTQQPGEEKPRMEISRAGNPVPYDELKKMRTADLVGCEITSFGSRVSVRPGREPLSTFVEREYTVGGGPGNTQTVFSERESAARVLETIYQLGILVASYKR